MRIFVHLCILAFLRSVTSNKVKRSVESTTLIVCEGGKLVANCPSGTSVNVTVADYGRTSIENICAKAGYEGNQLCRSERGLSLAYQHCRSKRICRIDVNGETLGRPITESGEGCFDASTYLRFVYSCVRDCQTPVFNYNTEAVGDEYHVGATVTVNCRVGYQRFDGTNDGVVKTCMDDGMWRGEAIVCQDVNECENPSTNRCHMFAKCKNTRGSYSCTCIDGYHGDGISCHSDSWFSDHELAESQASTTAPRCSIIESQYHQRVMLVTVLSAVAFKRST